MATIKFRKDDDEELTGRERLMLERERQRNFRQDILNQAHERFRQRRAQFVENNPYAVSVQERRQHFFGNSEDRGGQLANARGIAQIQADAQQGVARENRLGAERQADAAVKQSEIEWAGRRDVAGTQADAALKTEEARQRGALGVEAARQKGALDVAIRQGQDSILTEKERQGGAFDVAVQQGKNAKEVEEERTNQAEAQARAQERIAQAQIQAQTGKRVTMTSAQESQAARDLMKKTADAAGCGGVILVGDCCDPYSVEAVRATIEATRARLE